MRFGRLSALASVLTCLTLGMRSAAAQTPAAMAFADLAHYAAANRALPPAAPGESRVVFIGDSITQSWGDFQPEYFARADRINRGISGQATAQMLLRFRQDVIALRPAAVHILAGTNDLAGNVGPMDLEAIEANLASMVDLAHDHGIAVVAGSILPVSDYPWRPGLNPGPKVLALNDWLKAYVRQRDGIYVDYYTAMTDGALGMRAALAADGVHPTLEGYKVMLPLAEAGIAAALHQAQRRR